MALAKNTTREMQITKRAAARVAASTRIYQGSMVFESGTTGYAAKTKGTANAFMGFALQEADNSGGSAGDKTVELASAGDIRMPVTGASAVTAQGLTVYASDDDTLTTSSTNNTAVGKIKEWLEGTTCIVAFEAAAERSI